MKFHNRHPIYLDFEYTIEILKYSIKTSKADIYQEVFDVIDNYFLGINEDQPLEKFEVEYFHSNLEKRIDNDLSDITGFNNTVQTKLMLIGKNASQESTNTEEYDIYIPLSIPYETYFDNAGDLIIDKIPSIDTIDFIEELNLDVYTDWDWDGGHTSDEEILTAPIRAQQTESFTATAGQTIFTLETIEMHPDDVTAEVNEYTLLTITVDGTELNSVDYTINSSTELELNAGLTAGQELIITTNNQIGTYFIFNGYKKSIMVQFYVDGDGYLGSTIEDNPYTDPKAYLTSAEPFYDFTVDDYYLTTDGYALANVDAATAITGGIMKTISAELYSTSPLKRALFDTPRYLNFDYASPNFAILKNVIPRLRSVNFE